MADVFTLIPPTFSWTLDRVGTDSKFVEHMFLVVHFLGLLTTYYDCSATYASLRNGLRLQTFSSAILLTNISIHPHAKEDSMRVAPDGKTHCGPRLGALLHGHIYASLSVLGGRLRSRTFSTLTFHTYPVYSGMRP